MKAPFLAGLALIVLLTVAWAAEKDAGVAAALAVPYPDGYRTWRHVSSGVLQPMAGAANSQPQKNKLAAPHGLLANIYANNKAVEGYRTGHFPEGAALAVDWFVLEPRGPELLEGARKSVNVMIRDARYAATGGWGFEDFDKDSHTIRNVGPHAVKMCYECHQRAQAHGYVFSQLRP